jgi:hypothetical protein
MRVLPPSVLQAQIRPAVRVIDRRMDGPNAATRARAGVERAMARSFVR